MVKRYMVTVVMREGGDVAITKVLGSHNPGISSRPQQRREITTRFLRPEHKGKTDQSHRVVRVIRTTVYSRRSCYSHNSHNSQ